MKKLLIIDGHNLLFQMFYGMPNRFFGKNGIGLWAIVGFLGGIRKIIEFNKPDYFIVIFDGEENNPKKALLTEYKANRIDFSEVEDIDSPFTQLPYIYKALEMLDVKYYETKYCEADDIIAGYALKYKDKYKVVISSSDSDFYQMVNENVNIFRYQGKKSYFVDEKYITEKYNIKPDKYHIFKALIGDNADNIKGINGVGSKTASKLINCYESFEEMSRLYPNEKVRKEIECNLDRLKLNLELIELSNYANLPYDIDQLEYKMRDFSSNAILQSLDLI